MSAIEEEDSRVSSEGEGDDLRPEDPFNSSSEDEDEDDDEEEIQKIREGFIVDDDEEAEHHERKKKKHHHKRRREKEGSEHSATQEPEEDEGLLDEDDLDLLMENTGASSALKEKSQYKRLKRAESEDTTEKSRGLNDFFSDEEDEQEDDRRQDSRSQDNRRNVVDELDDFIEEDEFSDLDEEERQEARARRKQERMLPTEIAGIDSEKVDELYEIFGDGEDYAWALEGEEDEANNAGYGAASQGADDEEDSRPKLENIYEPEELKAKMLTANDKKIRDVDIPERYQQLRKDIKNYELSEEDFNYEKSWVTHQLVTEKGGPEILFQSFTEEEFRASVSDVLVFIAKENLEVPFIFAHRRDYLIKTKEIKVDGDDDIKVEATTLLRENDLWRILQLDIEFHSLLSKRKTVDKLMKELELEGDEYLSKAFNEATTITSLQDIHEFIMFFYADKLRDSGNKKSIRSSLFEKVKSNELFNVIKSIGITVDEFAENILSDSKLYPTKDADQSPVEMVNEICSKPDSLYAKTSQALDVVKHLFSEQIFYNLKIRNLLRSSFETFSSININLTEQGKLRINDRSRFMDFKYAINRSVESLIQQPDLFLRMLEAESLGLVEIEFKLISQDSFIETVYGFLASDGQSDIANAWNKLRKASLDLAFKKLIPLVTLNVKEQIRKVCERILFFQVRTAFLNKIDQAPYKPAGTALGTIPSVFAISPGNGRYGADAVIGVFINSNREVVETFKFNENPLQRTLSNQEKTGFELKFVEALQQYKPDVIGINGYNARTAKLFNVISNIIRNYDDLVVETDEQVKIPVVWVNDEIATSYQNSDEAKREFPDKSTLVRYTISLGRYLQSPLLEYISLGDNVTSLSIHKHQGLLSSAKLLEAISSAFVDIVNLVGVDINKAVRDPYLALCVPYISGLGPRKSSGLLKAVQQYPLFSRQALITNDNIRIGSAIFLNCASFLRIPQSSTRKAALRANDEAEAVTLLDDTRIHPEDYTLAEKMAADALDLDEGEIEELKDAPIGETIIDKLIEAGPETLQTLILEDYSKQLEITYHVKKRTTLEMIVEELQEPYFEMRNNFKLFNQKEIFENLTGLNDETFYEGIVLPVSIKRVERYDIKATTTTCIDCTADFDHAMGRNSGRKSLNETFYVTQVIPAKFLNINYENFSADISFLKQDIETPRLIEKFTREVNKWDFLKEQEDERKEYEIINAVERTTRTIQHPLFKNFNSIQAQNFLATKDVGSVVIRPSSKGNDHLTITWKVDNALYQNVDVVEFDKEHEGSLGKRLVISSMEFSDLDEIIELYVGKIVKKITEMKNHDKFRSGTHDEVVQWLENYSKANPKRASYTFAMNHKKPGWFLLLFKVNSSSQMYTWNVKATPDGFELNGYDYPDMTSLCNGFKTLIKNKQQTKRAQSFNPAMSSASNYGQGYGNYRPSY